MKNGLQKVSSDEEQNLQVELEETKDTNPEEGSNSPTPSEPDGPPPTPRTWRGRFKEIVLNVWFLGFVAFGGSNAHISLLLEHFVAKRKWVSQEMFSELIGLNQGLPGPPSTKIVFAIAVIRSHSYLVGLLAALLFMTPGFTIMTLSGFGLSILPQGNIYVQATEHALAASAVGLVALAIFRLISSIIKTKLMQVQMVFSAVVTLLYLRVWIFPVLIILGGIVSTLDSKLRPLVKKWRASKYRNLEEEGEQSPKPQAKLNSESSSPSSTSLVADEGRKMALPPSNEAHTLEKYLKVGATLLVIFVVLLIFSWVGPLFITNRVVLWFCIMYRCGAAIFGGGQVAIPLFIAELVNTGMVSERQFLDGFAIAQGIPGPMVSFSAYLGAVMGGLGGAFLCFGALFMPAMLISAGCLPFYMKFRRLQWFKIILDGMNASSLGLVMSSIFIVWNKAVKADPFLAALSLVTLSSVGWWKLPAPMGVILGGLTGLIIQAVKTAIEG